MSSGFTDPVIIDLLVPMLRWIGLDSVVAKKESTGLMSNCVWAVLEHKSMMVLIK